MRRLFPLIAACAIAAFAPDVSAQVAHMERQLDQQSLPVSTDVMNGRIAEAASKYQQYAPIPRFAQYDFAQPRDAQEYAALHGYGVVLVSVLTQQADELPPKRVYAKTGDTVVPLTLFSSGTSSAMPEPLVRRVFGPYRWEGLYLVPMNLYAGDAQLLIDFARNRDGFVVARFGERERRAAQKLNAALLPQGPPPQAQLLQFLAREYPGFIPPRAEANAAR